MDGVKLHAGLGGPNFQDAAGGRFDDASGQGFRGVSGAAQDKVVVVSTAEFYLLFVLIDARTDGDQFAKVERSARDVAKFAGGNQAGIDGSEFVGLNHKLVAEKSAGALAGASELRRG